MPRAGNPLTCRTPGTRSSLYRDSAPALHRCQTFRDDHDGALSCRDEERPGHVRSPGRSATWRIPSTGALASLAGRFDAAHALRADRCGVRGVRRQDHLVSRAELDVTAGGVEHDPAAHAVQHLFVAVLMPAIGIAGAVAPAVRAQALGAHPGCALLFAWRGAVMPPGRGVRAHRSTSSQPRV